MFKRLLIGLLAAVSLGAAAPAPPRATIAQGTLSGVRDEGVAVFKGIPFAAPPVGPLRWAPPRPAANWSGVRDASHFGASCTQNLNPKGTVMWPSEFMSPAEPGVSEDCLFANIWTPKAMNGEKPAAGLPVLVYIYGGGFTTGSGTVPVYDGTRLAKKGLVVVNFHYRVGPFGFFAHPQLTAEQNGASGNYGFQDQIAALQWVKANIAAFGGDPAKVTIAGQSAGASSEFALLVSPMAKGLFRGAIVMSALTPGTNGAYVSLAEAEAQGTAAFAQMGVSDLAAARALPADKVQGGGRPLLFADGKVVPAGAGAKPMISNVPVMIGYTLNDLFGSRVDPVTAAAWKAEAAERYGDQAAAFLKFYPGDSDAQATHAAHMESAQRTYMLPLVSWLDIRGATAPAYSYLFTHVEPGPNAARVGAFHSSDLPYMFDTLRLSPGREFGPDDRRLSDQLSGYVVNFVATGDPNGRGLPRWSAMTAQNKAVMELGVPVTPSRAVPAGADELIAAGKAPAAQVRAPNPPVR